MDTYPSRLVYALLFLEGLFCARYFINKKFLPKLNQGLLIGSILFAA